jgi:hypothetical protein
VDPDGNTVPVQYWLRNIYATGWDGITREENIVYNQWVQADESGNTENWARRTDYINSQTSMYFNIDFILSRASWVELRIYDLQGHEIVCLVDAYRQAGSHSLCWNAAVSYPNLPFGSGVIWRDIF